MNPYAYLMIATGILWFASVIVGYLICYFMVGPYLMAKHGKRSLKEMYIDTGNILMIEHELKPLLEQTNDKAILATLKTIKFCKYAIVVNFVLFVVFAVMNLKLQN